MGNVKLLEGMFNKSQEVGKKYLLKLDLDRLLAPIYESAGQEPKKPTYGGWESREISGHSLGHWLSAAAQMYQVTGQAELKEKIDYAVAELAKLQEIDDKNYIGTVPRATFEQVFNGQFEVGNFSLAGKWVPWSSQHKIYAGLIDVYRYGANSQALEIVIKLADWAKRGTDNLTEEQFKRMLIAEYGGMNNSLAILYEITDNQDYLELAKRFTDQKILDPLANREDILEGKHANTQIPKVIGAAKIYELNGNEDFKQAAEFFWDRVINHRNYVIGGHSRDEHFDPADTEKLGVTTAETCNTYNMLELTEHLYDWSHDVEYMDFYETALYNHILASQDPDSGMKTYFVATKPGHFKVYSDPEDSFWCCTGTGMENPARYTRGIYYREQDNLFVNLFISSEFDQPGISLQQKTNFPEEDTTKLVFQEVTEESLALKIRVPKWSAGAVTAIVNEEENYHQATNGYLTIERVWKVGDTIEVNLPLELHLDVAMNDPQKVAIKYGPIVLAGALGKENFPEADIVPDHLQYNNYPGIDVPTLVIGKQNVEEWIKPVADKPITFKTTAIGQPGNQEINLIPFYNLHHQRYTVYWKKMTHDQYQTWQEQKKGKEEKLEAITVDLVKPNQQQSEIEHNIEQQNSDSGYLAGAEKGWRHCYDRGFFSYDLAVKSEQQMYLVVTYWGSDAPMAIDGQVRERDFNIVVNGQVIANQTLDNNQPGETFKVSYPLPEELTTEEKITVKFASQKGTIAGGVYGVRVTSELL